MITGAIVVSAMGIAYSEQCGNWTKGKGFQSNDNVQKDFVSQSKQQEAIDYFGFKEKYAPSTLFNNDVGGGDVIVNLRTGEIFYSEGAFNSGYDRLVFTADHELIHNRNFLLGKYKGVQVDSEVASKEEWSTYMKNYQRQGLYHKHGVDIIDRINSYGYQAGIYELVIKPSDSYSTKFIIQWWHFIYSIPRRW